MNPLSIEGNSINSSPDELLFRASLGGELDTSTDLTQVSIHPKITGSWVVTSSFTSDSNYTFNGNKYYEGGFWIPSIKGWFFKNDQKKKFMTQYFDI